MLCPSTSFSRPGKAFSLMYTDLYNCMRVGPCGGVISFLEKWNYLILRSQKLKNQKIFTGNILQDKYWLSPSSFKKNFKKPLSPLAVVGHASPAGCGGCVTRYDQFLNRKCAWNLRSGGLFAHFLFENRPMIDFQIENAPETSDLAAFSLISYLKIDQWSIFR